jgi:hypothetical protein
VAGVCFHCVYGEQLVQLHRNRQHKYELDVRIKQLRRTEEPLAFAFFERIVEP